MVVENSADSCVLFVIDGIVQPASKNGADYDDDEVIVTDFKFSVEIS